MSKVAIGASISLGVGIGGLIGFDSDDQSESGSGDGDGPIKEIVDEVADPLDGENDDDGLDGIL